VVPAGHSLPAGGAPFGGGLEHVRREGEAESVPLAGSLARVRSAALHGTIQSGDGDSPRHPHHPLHQRWWRDLERETHR